MGVGVGQGVGVMKPETSDDGYVQMSVPDLLKWVKDSNDTAYRPEVSVQYRHTIN